jgi:lauroyl/myristoyl acyltransferase
LADNFPDSLLVAVFVIFTWLYFILWLAFVMPWLVGRKAGEIVSRHMH